MRKVIQEGWGWLFSFVNKGVMEGFTKKMTFGQRLAEGEEISHVPFMHLIVQETASRTYLKCIVTHSA